MFEVTKKTAINGRAAKANAKARKSKRGRKRAVRSTRKMGED